MPVWNILVGYSACYVKHNDSTLALNIISVPKTTELLLTGSVPHVKSDGATVCVEKKGVNLHTKGGDVLLLKLTLTYQIPIT